MNRPEELNPGNKTQRCDARRFELTDQQIRQITMSFLRRLIADHERRDKSVRERLMSLQTFTGIYDVVERYYIHNGKIPDPNQDADYIILEIMLQIQIPDLLPQSRFGIKHRRLAA